MYKVLAPNNTFKPPAGFAFCVSLLIVLQLQMAGSVRLIRAESGREVEISLSRSYTVDQLSRIFNVDPSTIWLKCRYRESSGVSLQYFPNIDGIIDL